mmetsp:Transcript_4921/g.7369  ORF Transcript_4921/g.7369 Transcript_4921/m.7369 type:complete len:164 (+) Transcript_4921:14-505(+)
MKLLILLLACLFITTQAGNVIRPHEKWMRKNQIDPDFMHLNAMAVRSRARVIQAKVQADDISAKEIDFSATLNEAIVNTQRFLYGILNGTSTISENTVCTDSMINFVDQAFKLINYRFIWLPEYSIKFTQAQSQMTSYQNTAYAYCNFNQVWAAFTALWDPAS